MSDYSIQWIVGRASTNRTYRDLLLSNFSQAVAGYDLTESETAQVKLWSSNKREAVIELDDLVRHFGEELPQLSAGERKASLSDQHL